MLFNLSYYVLCLTQDVPCCVIASPYCSCSTNFRNAYVRNAFSVANVDTLDICTIVYMADTSALDIPRYL